MTRAERKAINRQNSAHSTGPATPQGKHRASLNALRHGLTGQTIVLPTDDLAAYQESCRQYHAELKPQGLRETEAVQIIADTYWRLHRIRAMEHNLFSLGVHEQSSAVVHDDPAIQSALAQAKSIQANADILVRLSLYEQRLNRTLGLAEAKLKQLQHDRQPQPQDLLDAHRICKLKKTFGESWEPAQDGFEFSSERLAAWSRRYVLTRQGNAYDNCGLRPSQLGL